MLYIIFLIIFRQEKVMLNTNVHKCTQIVKSRVYVLKKKSKRVFEFLTKTLWIVTSFKKRKQLFWFLRPVSKTVYI